MANSRHDKRGAWKDTPGLKDRVIAFCALFGPKAGNSAIVHLVAREFRLEVTEHQVAGVVHRWGIVRGHPRHGGQPSQRDKRDQDRVLRQVDRHEHHNELAREREAAARARRNVDRMARESERMHQRLEAGPDPELTVTSVGARAHDIAMARPTIIARPSLRQHQSVVPKVTLEPLRAPTPVARTVADGERMHVPAPSEMTHEAPGVAVLAGGEVTPIRATRAVSIFDNATYRAPQPAPAPIPKASGRTIECQFPIGEPGQKDFHFCDVPSEPGRPYCEDHVKLCYPRVRDRREDTVDPLPRYMAGYR